MRIAAQNPNVYAKISGLGTASGDAGYAGAPDDIRPYLDYVLETFGPERCMTGGDWPVSVLAGGYEKAWRAYRRGVTRAYCAGRAGRSCCFGTARFRSYLDAGKV